MANFAIIIKSKRKKFYLVIISIKYSRITLKVML